jgi:hypothetical protein
MSKKEKLLNTPIAIEALNYLDIESDKKLKHYLRGCSKEDPGELKKVFVAGFKKGFIEGYVKHIEDNENVKNN